ncbi:MAG TPA: DivIVA domain-containing protein [Acidimicrobiales bacterium]
MDSDHTTSALDSIDTVAFKVGVRGYNIDEVDDFLERLSLEVRQLKDLAAQQRQQLRQAAERISQLDARPAAAAAPTPTPVVHVASAPAPAPISTGGAAGAEQVTTMIAMAQRFIEEAQAEAEERARDFTAAAQDRAREIVNEARSRAEDEVNRLNGMKQRLSEDVDTLAHQLNAERKRIAIVLAEFTEWVENSLSADASTRSLASPASSAPTPPARPAPVPSPEAPPPPAPRPSDVPPPAAAPSANAGEATMAQPTLGQVLKFDRDER